MTKKNILNRILNKNHWTGQEVGKALLLNLKHDIENKGSKTKKPLFSQDEFNIMLDSLESDYQYTQYKVLESIYRSIVDSFNYNQAMVQQFYNGYYRYTLAIRETKRAEDMYKNMEKFPLILSQGQYDEISQKITALKREEKESYYTLFFCAVESFTEAVEYNRTANMPEAIKLAILDTKKQKVANSRILANWAKDTHAGYYILPDGQRSDKLPPDEWAICLGRELSEIISPTIDGEKQDTPATEGQLTQASMYKEYELLFKGTEAIKETYRRSTGETITEEEAKKLEEALERMIDGKPIVNLRISHMLNEILKGEKIPLEWHFYKEPPAAFSKYDVLITMLDRYNGHYKERLLKNGRIAKEVTEKQQYEEFIEDYPVLSAAIQSYVESRIPSLKGLKASQIFKKMITWGELATIRYSEFQHAMKVSNDDIANYILSTQEGNTVNLNKYNRAKNRGIAIMQDPVIFDVEKGKLFDSWDYTDPVADKKNFSSLQNIDFLQEHPAEAEYIQANLDYLALPALKYIYAYNTFIDVISAAYDIDFMEVAKFDLSAQEKQIMASNNLLFMLYKSSYGTKADKQRKRKFLKEHFQPIDLEDLKPTREATAELQEKINALGYTKAAIIALKNYRSLITGLEKGLKTE